MTKKLQNRFDPFLPVKMAKFSGDITNESVNTKINDFFSDFGNMATVDEKMKIDAPRVREGFVIVVTKKSLGEANGLGEKLLEEMLISFVNGIELPQYLIFMNEAVLLLNYDVIRSLIITAKRLGITILESLESSQFFKCDNVKGVMKSAIGDISGKVVFAKRLIML